MATIRIGKAPGAAVEVPRPTKDTAPTAYVATTKTPPTIDGKCDEAAWDAAQIIHIGWTLDGSAVADQDTEVRLLRDGENLYVAYRCREPFVGKLRAGVKGHDEDPWNDDSVEMFLGTDEEDDYYHVIINSLGTTYDGFNKDKAPETGVRAAAAVGKDAWTAEMAFSLDKLKVGGKRPTKWIANWVRNRYTRGRMEELAWSPTFSGDSHLPKRFGTVLFAEPPAEIMAAQKPKPLPKGVAILAAGDGTNLVRFDLSAVPADAKIVRAELLMFRTGTVTGRDDEAMVDPEIVAVSKQPPAEAGGLVEAARQDAGGKPNPPLPRGAIQDAAASKQPPPEGGGSAKAGGSPAGKPLELLAPWYDRFDATEAVRAAIAPAGRRGLEAGKPAAAPSADFLVKAFPLWNAEGTCLDIAYAGKGKDLPPAATGLRVFHRAGQTFITWKEIEDALGKAECRWGELRGVLGRLDNARQVRYAIYRSKEPITAKTLDAAQRIALVAPLSCWNINGRNIEQPIDEALSAYSMIHHQWDPFVNAAVDGPFGLDCRMQRFVIDEKPDGTPAEALPPASGLYVHTLNSPRREAGVEGGPAQNPPRGAIEKVYYAVVTCIDGVENTAELSAANSLEKPVAESPADPTPVLQGVLPPRPYWDYDEDRFHYVHWVAPPLGNLPYQYFNWAVAVPRSLTRAALTPAAFSRDPKGSALTGSAPLSRDAQRSAPEGVAPQRLAPLELSLHRDGQAYYRTQYRIDRASVVLIPHDFPLRTWWFGYHESQGTLRSFRQGSVHNYTERRILAFMDWAAAKWPVDRARTIVTGTNDGASSAARRLAARYPKVFTQCAPRGGGRGDYARSMEDLWGQPAWQVKTEGGKSVWSEAAGR